MKMAISFFEFLETLRTDCHDCGEIIQCPKGEDGLPISPKGKHGLFYHMNIGWFLCCKTSVQEIGTKNSDESEAHGLEQSPEKKGKKRKSLLYHPCRW
jgi:hypothetical protein